jgi:DNA-binding SARP family transcriptional activator
MLRLRSFGAPALVAGTADVETVVIDVSKLLAVVTYLAAAPQRSASRDHLTDLLWDNLEPDAARHALRHARWQIHQKTKGAISIEGDDALRLETPVPWDRDDFLAAAEAGDCMRAVHLYSGDFFPGFASPGSGEFERWADVERQRLHGIFVRCGEMLVRQWLSQGRSRDAILLARRIRDSDPLRLTGWRLLLEALVAARDTFGASVEADALERVIQENGIEPEPSVRSLLSVVRRQQDAAEPERPSSPLARLEMVGREREFAALMQAWERAASGHSTLVAVTGPVGFGKTRLLRELSARLQSLHARHVVVRASHASRDVDFAVASDVAEKLGALSGARAVSTETARTLVRLNPALAAQYTVSDSAVVQRLEPVAVRNALRDLIDAVGFEKPLAILLDDLHWCDDASRRVLAGALEGLERKPVLLVASDRQAIRRSDVWQPTHAVSLPPLTHDAVWTLLGSVANVPNAPWVAPFTAALVEYTGGAPLQIIQVLQLALDRSLIALIDSEWNVGDPAALFQLLRSGSALRERMRQLKPRQLLLLRVLAIGDEGLEAPALARLTRQSEPAVRQDLAELELDGYVSRDGSRWLLMHQEFGEAAFEGDSAEALQELEASLGRILAESPGDAGAQRRAVAHLRAAGDFNSLSRILRDAMQQAARRGERPRRWASARELLGAGATDAELDRLVRALPPLARMGLITRRQRALAMVGVIAIALLAGATLLRQTEVEVDPTVLYATALERPAVGTTVIWEFPVNAATTGGTARTDLFAGARRLAILKGSIAEVVPVHGRQRDWLIVKASPDSGDMDIYYRDATGRERRLTQTLGDDVHPELSPDRRFLAFASAASDPLQHTDIAILEMATGQVRLLTSGDPSDLRPRWSPSATRLAFIRKHFDRNQMDVCLTSLEGGASCEPLPHKMDELRWVDDMHLQLWAAGGSGIRIDLGANRMAMHPLPRGSAEYTIAPGGRWMLCACASASRSGSARHLQLYRVDADSSYVPVSSDISGRVFWQMPFRLTTESHDYIDRLTRIADTAVALLGVPFVVGVGGVDALGRAADVHHVTLRSSNQEVAAVDSGARLVPLQTGYTTVHISAGGWRRT